MMQILMQRAVLSVINLIGQTDLLLPPQTAKLTLTQTFREANNTDQQIKWDSADNIHSGASH